MPVQRYGDVRFYLFHLIRYLTVLQFVFNRPPVSKKRSVNSRCTKVEVLAIPLKRDRQVHAMTKHSIDIALKISFHFEKCQFSTLRYSANEYVIYKDEITAKTVQSPLFSYVTSAKVVKIIEKLWQTIKNPAVLSQQGRI